MAVATKTHLIKNRLKLPLKPRLNLKTEHRNILTNVVILSNNTTTINGDTSRAGLIRASMFEQE